MGCSPSRGTTYSGAYGPFRKGKTLLPGTKESPGDSQSDDGGSGSSIGGETDDGARERTGEQKKLNNYGDTNTPSSAKKLSTAEPGVATVASEKLGTQEITISLLSQTKEKQDEKKDEKKGTKKPKKSLKGVKPNKKKEKDKKAAVEEKVDFPEPLVKAHQAAYGYLNPSIAKYEILLSLLDHAAQTQISLQPMVSFMALRYEEINRGLEEMVEEGEKLLKENGEHLAWPCKMKNLSSSSSSTEPPPDLLQQLLQYTVQRMRVVGQSVSGISDTALEEAVDYFSSICEVLEKKLRAKRACEAKLMQLLTKIEVASLRRPGPEDSALFSEDSGIGVENESLAGSERQRRRRESCESTGSNCTILCSPGSTTPVRLSSSKRLLTKKMSKSSSINSIDSTCTLTGKESRDTESLLGSTSLDDGEGDEEEGTEEASEGEHCEGKTRKRSSSSPADPAQQPRRLPAKRIENPQNVEMTLKMKDAISGRIHFLPSQRSGIKTGKTGSPKVGDRQWTEDREKSPKRPQTASSQAPKKKATAAKQCRSRSAESLRNKAEDPTLFELERTQKELSQRLEQMRKVRFEGNIKKDFPKQLLEQQTHPGSPKLTGKLQPLNKNPDSPSIQRKTVGLKQVTAKQEAVKEKDEKDEKKKKSKTVKGPLKPTPPPSPPISPQPVGMGGNSVKKLIDTFSQGMEDSKHIHDSTKVLGPLKGVRKCGVPIIPGLGSTYYENDDDDDVNREESGTSARTDDLDLDNLPPPPPEVLMDNSFENFEATKTEESVSRRGRSTIPKKTSISQRLRASMQSVAVLPSKGNVRKSSHSMSPARTVPQELRAVVKNTQFDSKAEAELENEEAASLYKQARKIIHLRNATDSPIEKLAIESDSIKTCLTQQNMEKKQEENSTPETVPSTSVGPVGQGGPVGPGGQPPATPPVSKTRMLPSTPVLHRRLPSPPVFKKQSVHPTPSPPVFRKLPTPPPAGQRTLSTTPNMRQETTPSSASSTSIVTYPFKAPSPPASPKVQRWSRENSKEDSTSRVFSNARSVFCPASPSLFEAQPFPVPKPPQAWTSTGSSILPRPWGERGRLPMSIRGPQPFIRRSQSDRRPSLSFPPRAPVISVAQTCGSEPAISTQGLEDGPMGELEPWSEQTELRGASRSASHPDLCIVGQALQRE
ncbi:photoreceptor cilium actin regulator [Astyanax mexicanus]|uniref:photoreceptor cilium actin regulator n=1 Tax=Astyanax mexicanus TaxID=7994 RepID=UPI0020CAAE4D|nr:photoreceptor cilium actin regulator [Astyanax mexicanus]